MCQTGQTGQTGGSGTTAAAECKGGHNRGPRAKQRQAHGRLAQFHGGFCIGVLRPVDDVGPTDQIGQIRGLDADVAVGAGKLAGGIRCTLLR